MPTKVFSSHNLFDLSEALSISLKQEIRESDGLYSPVVIIPNKSMETWLNLDLVQRFGVVFNIRFLFLEKILEELLLQKFSPEMDLRSRPFLRGEAQKFQIYETLLKNPEMIKKYPSLKTYLLPADRKNIDPIRLWDLSGRLAKYFKDYELHRQDWIKNWIGDPYAILRLPGEDIWEEIATQSEIFFFQKELYSLITKSSSKESLIQYSMRMLGTKDNPLGASHNIYLFALSQLSSTYVSIFRSLLPEVELRVFQFGVPADETVSGLGRDQICRGWANSFRALRKSWVNADSEFIEVSSREKEKDPNVLNVFQKYLIYGKGGVSQKVSPDESLQVMEAPSKLREVEAVFHHMLAHLSETSETKLTDFGIFCTDLSAYRPAIEFIFEGGILTKTGNRAQTKTLPYTIRDVIAGDTSKYLNAILSLFPLLSGKRSRASLFSLFLNPCFQERWELDSSIVKEWASFAEDLELYQDDSKDGSPLSFSFRKGFLRLAVGNILSDLEEENSPISPYDPESHSSAVWIGVWKRVSSLLDRFSEKLNDPKTSGEELIDSLIALLRSILTSQISDLDESEIEKAILDSLFELRSISWDTKDSKDRIRFLEKFLKQSSGEIQVRKGQYLTGGITVSALQPMRPIPFKHVYVLGLGEGLFPGTDDTSSFNLRYLSPREGDIGLRELNQSLLYETILSARESLTLSFVAEDITKDESIAPSSSLLLLEQALKENVLVPEASVRIQIPLNKHSREYFEPKEASSHKNNEKFLANFDLSSSLIYGKKEDKDFYSKNVMQSLRSPEIIPKKPTLAQDSLDWNELVRFARSPLSFHLQKRFGLYVEEISETESKREEPFRISDEFEFMNDLWNHSLQKRSSLELKDSLDPIYGLWEKKGKIPRGVFGDAEFLIKAEKIAKISDSLSEELENSKILTGISFGESPKQGDLLRLSPISLPISDGANIKVVGLKENVLLRNEMDGSNSLFLVYPNSSKRLKNLIEPFLLQCLLDSSSEKNIPKSVYAILGYGDKPVILRMDREGQESLRKEFLSDLVKEFLKPFLSLVSPRLWEDFPEREELKDLDAESYRKFATEYKVWASQSVQYDPETYLDSVLKLLPHPQKYINESDFTFCMKIYQSLSSVLHVEK
ncbi:exodeoxyribonuclease V subunit gamma [Leptospira langatensis]|uniref:Exodeoxyribonuclease V subunit gamma n=1 Tax=Leptospira langatensis TaxID=2484983 RepID=A0A5F1ZPN9_9LEPT|nr:exodeoxyribonuclease V subunit gamma [Leptospira langatensis]TGK01844.1 exodeoxyribonuclease V subunit gamma [Leptospira langatensis]TGL39449.1 exodeoxyribonuclease V subunit gamma [Leptospira langatensis]